MQHQAARRTLSKCLLAAGVLTFALVAIAFTPAPAHAQTFTTLYTFPGGSQGYSPYDIVVAPDGTIYGGAAYGSNCPCNLIFSVSNGTETVLHRFNVPFGDQSEYAQGLILGHNSEILYGTSQFGGTYGSSCGGLQMGCGFAFAYNLTSRSYRVLHDFSGPTTDGAFTTGTQVLDPSGNLYGLTWGGGANGTGAVYEIPSKGSERLVYSFGNAPDATDPADLVGYSGSLYGVSVSGGANVCNNGNCGTIFEVSSAGEKVLYSFTGGTDGQNPYELVGDSKGHFYGVSRNASNVVIAVFEIDASGQFSIAYNGDFAAFMQWVIPGPNGTLYGVATGGNSKCGSTGCGQIFQLTPTGNGNGNITILHQFDGTDGENPQLGSLVLKNGALYGSTAYGGSTNQGTIFKLVP